MSKSTQIGIRQDSNSKHTPVVLVVDDDPALRLVLRHTMEQDGYYVIRPVMG